MDFTKLFEPITINHLTIKNRIAMPAMALFYTDNYSFNEKYEAFYRVRAQGGVGLMTIGPVAIDTVGSTPLMLGLFEDKFIEPFRNFIEDLHRERDVKIGTQLMHLGRYASEGTTGTTAIAPSAIPSPLNREVPREMTEDDIAKVQDAYAEAAIRARKAGFDYIEIMAAGGYLIGEFLSPVSNNRTDDYGGSRENRMRFGLEVIRSVREAIGNNATMGIRVSGHDYMKGGNTLIESALFCREAEKAGVDAVSVTGGWHETTIPQITSDVPPGTYLYLARSIRDQVGIPVFASNRLGDPLLAEKSLRSGAADMICWGRPLIADPELPNKVQTGRLHERIPCIGCNQGCLDAVFSECAVHCTVNPSAGREAETMRTNPKARKRICVAGGGPAGMEFALAASERGHDVTLYEKKDKLGGQINLIGSVPGKGDFLGAVKSLENRLENSAVSVRLKTALTVERLEKDKPDVLIVASGGRPETLNVPGIDQGNVFQAWNVLEGNVTDIGKHVVIIGGGATGCETAMLVAHLDIPSPETFAFLVYHSADDPDRLRQMLFETGRKITILEMKDRFADDVGISTRWSLIKRLKLLSVVLCSKTEVLRIEENTVVIKTDKGVETVPADTVIVATGSRSVDDLARSVKGRGIDVLIIGDAKEPRKITDAVLEGFLTALKVS